MERATGCRGEVAVVVEEAPLAWPYPAAWELLLSYSGIEISIYVLSGSTMLGINRPLNAVPNLATSIDFNIVPTLYLTARVDSI